MLKEGIESTGEFRVATAHAGEDALESVVERPFDMVIVDMGLSDVEPPTLVKAIREAKPSMRLVLIPLFGQQIPDELQGLEIQGILPKPFFVGDLPQIVSKALDVELAGSPMPSVPELKVAVSSRSGAAAAREAPSVHRAVREPARIEETPVSPPPPAPPTPAPAYSAQTLTRLQAQEREIVQLLKSLNREVRAESIMVTLGAELVAFSGLLGREQAAELAALVATISESAARSAAFLGEPEGRFEQSLHEGAEYRLYSFNLSEGLVLSLALSSDIPLGTLRYRARQTAEELLELLS
jgi:DNA-binding NarL/FixJ family response regulator/predicted regulator of Ras-like GTPase activity (Roadblock/LC7/MglB family)